MRSTQAIINLSSFRHNIAAIKNRLARQTKLCVPVKADAYGHGAVPCALAALESGADFLGVATVAEGTELRLAGIRESVLLFGPLSPEEIPELVAEDLCPFVFEGRAIQLLDDEAARQGKILSVHLKVDTGMGRIGCTPEDAVSVAQLIKKYAHLTLGGMCTHFAVSDSPESADLDFTRLQFRRFTAAIEAVRQAGIDTGICHCANSGAVATYPEMQLDMVRPGIMCYGYYSGSVTGKIAIEPVMDMVTRISAIKNIPAGMSVSYGRRWTSTVPSRIATLPLGYADGLRRSLFLTGLQVAVKGKGCPVTGTICMDQCMVDVTSVNGTDCGDAVIVFGAKKRGALLDAGDMAELIGTIPYEILTSISKRVPRIYR
jgi:alanine racemase